MRLYFTDCDYINAQGGTSGVQILSFEQTVVESFCDITEERAWLVIQRRVDDSVDFYRSWMEYAEGMILVGEPVFSYTQIWKCQYQHIHSCLAIGD